jgi:hypothetical protein
MSSRGKVSFAIAIEYIFDDLDDDRYYYYYYYYC